LWHRPLVCGLSTQVRDLCHVWGFSTQARDLCHLNFLNGAVFAQGEMGGSQEFGRWEFEVGSWRKAFSDRMNRIVRMNFILWIR